MFMKIGQYWACHQSSFPNRVITYCDSVLAASNLSFFNNRQGKTNCTADLIKVDSFSHQTGLYSGKKDTRISRRGTWSRNWVCVSADTGDNVDKTIRYWCKICSDRRRSLVINHQEELASVNTTLSRYLHMEDTKFTYLTDHNALRWMLNKVGATGKLARWRLCFI